MPFVRRKRGQVLVVHNRRVAGGGSEQVVLHAFAAPEELRDVVKGDRWETWRAELEWQHPDHTWRWVDLRARLTAELAAWDRAEAPGGALRRRIEVLRRQADQLATDLRVVSPARPPDAVMISASRDALESLRSELDRLLGPSTVAAPDRTQGEHDAHALNQLGCELLEAGRFRAAEGRFRAAVEAGARTVEREGERIVWGRLENRPYLRALGNLAISLSRQGRCEEAVELWEKLLELNPGDNQGVRFLVGQGYHRLGCLESAIRAYEGALEDPGACFDLSLALLASGEEGRAAVPILNGFAGNRYIAPMLLGERWRRLDGFHATSLAEPERAREYLEHQGDLWRATPGSFDLLRRWWSAEPVRAWRGQLDEALVQLGKLPAGVERDAVVALHTRLTSGEQLAEVARAVDPLVAPPPRKGARRRSPK